MGFGFQINGFFFFFLFFIPISFLKDNPNILMNVNGIDFSFPFSILTSQIVMSLNHSFRFMVLRIIGPLHYLLFF